MAAAKRINTNIDEILGVVLESDSSDIDLDEDSELDSDWEYESGEEEQYEPSHENLDEADEAVEDSETEGEAVAAESN